MCEKRGYGSKRQAREANRNNSQTLRCYFHRECGSWHVTKDRKPGRNKPLIKREVRER